MADSFTDALEALKTLLEEDSALGHFCQSKWNRPLSAKITFKKRPEVHTQDLPQVLITRPGVTDRSMQGDQRQGKHRVRLYAGFFQNDNELIVTEQIGFEEKIDDVITQNYNLNDTAKNTIVIDSANDEGAHHPVCFTVIDLDVWFRRPVGYTI